ncbi:hypothetical protein SAMN04488102_101344 [Alkalibacterium subtropicum]|uniref:Uncharacterized protein n=1 Tax=Alkalibacterium subtropicum TaxID=753702 RepID=A0A1I1ET74_9LACT|nr:hypothetical protein [Alkalibacterium subtropicum]SFB90324.1 hypothetical protein SAMN04488102_101344 [Alkalibacterium subtropicum]
MNEKEWKKVVERGSVVPPYYEPAHSAQSVYWTGEIEGEHHEEYLGEMPQTYYDKRYVDWFYYTFTALEPDPDEIGMYIYRRTDEDEGVFEFDEWYSTYIENTSHWKTEKEFMKGADE